MSCYPRSLPLEPNTKRFGLLGLLFSSPFSFTSAPAAKSTRNTSNSVTLAPVTTTTNRSQRTHSARSRPPRFRLPLKSLTKVLQPWASYKAETNNRKHRMLPTQFTYHLTSELPSGTLTAIYRRPHKPTSQSILRHATPPLGLTHYAVELPMKPTMRPGPTQSAPSYFSPPCLLHGFLLAPTAYILSSIGSKRRFHLNTCPPLCFLSKVFGTPSSTSSHRGERVNCCGRIPRPGLDTRISIPTAMVPSR